MRTYSYILLIMLSFISYNQKALGQEREVQSVLVGTWTLDYNATFARREMQMKTIMDTMPQAQQSSIEKNYRDRMMVFEPNGGFRLLFPDGRNANGSWALDQKNMDLVITDVSGRNHVHKIKELTDKVMVLRLEDSGDSKLFVKEMYFVKN